MKTRIIFVISLVFLFLINKSIAQIEYVEGTDFLVPFISQGQEVYTQGDYHITTMLYSGDSSKIYILGHEFCTGYIANPHTSYILPFTVYPDSLLTIKIPPEEFQSIPNGVSGVVSGKTILVHTTKKVQAWYQSPISYYNYSTANVWGAFQEMNIPALPYKIRLFPTSFYKKYVKDRYVDRKRIVVAIFDSTLVNFNTNNNILLNKGDVLWLSTDTSTFIYACKPIISYHSSNATSQNGGIYDINLEYGKIHIYRALNCKHLYYFNSMYFNGEYNASNLSFYPFTPNTINQYSNTPSVTSYAYHSNYINCYGYGPDSVIYSVIKNTNPSYSTYRIHYLKPFYINHCSIGVGARAQYFPYSHIKHPTDRMSTHWDYPISKCSYQFPALPENFQNIDTNYVDLTIYVKENGIATTKLNGQLIPPTAFDTVPFTNGEYYSAQFSWYNLDLLPDYITVDNPNGFVGHVSEIGYSWRWVTCPLDLTTKKHAITYYFMYGSSPYDYMESEVPHSNLSFLDSTTVYRCLGDSLNLIVEHNPDSFPIEWIVNGESHFTNSYSQIINSLDTMTVHCVIHRFCPDTTTTFVVPVPPPYVENLQDTTLCQGAVLSAEQPDALSYLWSNGATTPSISIDSAGIYKVEIENKGCTLSSGEFNVDLYPQSDVNFGNDSILCELETLLLDATQAHTAQYLWQDESTNTTYTVYYDGEYWVVITDNCLGASDTINVDYIKDFNFTLGNDTILCDGRFLTLSADVPYCDYLWQDGSTDTRLVVTTSGNYSLEISNLCFSHYDEIDVEFEQCDNDFFAPNAFAPAGSTLNRIFYPVFNHPEEIEDFSMEIYNRWGELVFKTDNHNAGWDGGDFPSGVYVCHIAYKMRGKTAKRTTIDITLVR